MRYTIPNLAKNVTARWKELILNYTPLFSFQSLTNFFNYSMISYVVQLLRLQYTFRDVSRTRDVARPV